MTELTPSIRSNRFRLLMPLIGGGGLDIRHEVPEKVTLVVFYRGLRCPDLQDSPTDRGSPFGGDAACAIVPQYSFVAVQA